jgi:hypothetical protein
VVTSTLPKVQQKIPIVAERRIVQDYTTFAQNHAVFYNIFIPASMAAENVADELELITQQLNIVATARSEGSSNNATTVFINTGGHELLNSALFCQNNTKLDCRRMAHTKEQYAGESLTQLHDFCQQRTKSSRVTYIHNHLPTMLERDNVSTRRIKLAVCVAYFSIPCQFFQ